MIIKILQKCWFIEYLTIYNNLDDIIFQVLFTYTLKTPEDIFYIIIQEIQPQLFIKKFSY